MRRAGIVLCGGRSRRMGRPKALLPWRGRTLVEHVVARLLPCVDEVLVVTARDLPIGELVAALGARPVVDRDTERGPLAALRDGLAETRAGLAFVTATDAPCLTAEAIGALFARAEAGVSGRSAGASADAGGGAGAEGRAVVPRAGGHLQVLSAVYPARAGREAAALLEAEGAAGGAARAASPMRLLERIGFEAIDEPAAAGALDSPPPWTSFNTPDDYLALARREHPGASASILWATAPSGASARSEAPTRTAPIGRLGEILRATAPAGFPLDALDDREALAGLSVSLGEGALALRLAGLRPEDLALPIGPDERLRVSLR